MNHTITKDFLFIFFNIGTYDDVKTKKEVIPLDINEYGSEILILTHLLHARVYTIYSWFYVQVSVLPMYIIRDFWKYHFEEMLVEIYKAFWLQRIPFMVVWINIVEWVGELDIWLIAKKNSKKIPIKFFKWFYLRVKKRKKLLKKARYWDQKARVHINWYLSKINRFYFLRKRKNSVKKLDKKFLNFFKKCLIFWK